MEEQNTVFETRLKELAASAAENKGVIDSSRINDFFKEMNLNVSQIDQIYEYLEANNIAVLNLSEEEPDDDALLELEDDDDLIMEEEDLSAIANAMADDPVRQYLKEIGGFSCFRWRKKSNSPGGSSRATKTQSGFLPNPICALSSASRSATPAAGCPSSI